MPMGPAPFVQKPNAPALISLILGLAGCILPFVGGIAAIWLAITGIRRTKDPAVGGKGLAIAGLIFGILSTLLWVMAIFGLYLEHSNDLAARPSAQAFLSQMANDRPDQALATTDEMTVEELETLYADHFENWGPLQGVDWSGTAFDTDTPTGTDRALVRGMAQFQNGRQKVSIVMHRRGGAWRVEKFEVQPGGDPAPAGGGGLYKVTTP
jgi:hypothetical protein